MEKLSDGVQLLYHLFLSQTADPPLSKATMAARLQLAYKPAWLFIVTVSSVAEFFELRIPRFPLFRHFTFLRSSFLVLPVPFCECVCLFRLYFTS